MSEPESVSPDDLWWAEAPLKERLLRDPAAVLKDRGITVPDGTALPVIHELLRIVSLLWIDGAVLPLEKFSIDPADEGLLFGRGVWESTRTIGAVPWLWSWHIDRLRRTAAIVGIDVAPERLPDADEVAGFVRRLTTQDVVVRLNVTAGRPGKPGLVWMSAALLSDPPASIRLKSCWNPVQKGQPYLTLKTFQYATRLRIGQEAVEAGYDTALMVDPAGNLLEAAHANLFVRLPDGWATPPIDGGLLPGTVRQYLLQKGPVPIRERPVSLSQLGEIQEAFVTNSNVGITPVVQIDQHQYPIGDETTKLKQWIAPRESSGPQFRFVETETPVR